MYFFYVFACACGLNPAFGCQKKINVVCFVLFVNRLQSIRQTDWQTVKRIFFTDVTGRTSSSSSSSSWGLLFC